MFRFCVLPLSKFVCPRRQFCFLPQQKSLLQRSDGVRTYNEARLRRTFSLESWSVALSRSTPVSYAQELLHAVHLHTGLSWCTTIIVTSLALRVLITLPLAVYQSHIIARLKRLNSEIAQIAQELKGETTLAVKAFKLTEKQAKLLYRRSVRFLLGLFIVLAYKIFCFS